MIKCEICNIEFESLRSLSNHIARSKDGAHPKSTQDYYDQFINKEFVKCQNPECQNKSRFNTFVKGYFPYCSMECSIANRSNRIKQTTFINHGVYNCSQLDWVKDKKIETSRKHYGADYPWQTQDIKDKKNATVKRVYEVNYISQYGPVKEKAKQTNLLKYETKYPVQSKEVKDKIKQTLMKRYNVDNCSKLDWVKQKKKETCFKNHGVEYGGQTDQYSNKCKETSLKRYGFEYPLNNIELQNKLKQIQRSNMIDKIFNNNRAGAIPLFTPEEYIDSYQEYPWKCHICDFDFNDKISYGTITRCPKCHPRIYTTSKPEQEIAEFCQQYYPQLITNDRTILDGKEIDIFIPEINLGIEFNGLYWHSEAQGKDSNYHLNKTILTNSKGIHLIHIFEDEWINKKEIIKSIILHKIDKIINEIDATDCTIKPTSNKEAEEFLNSNDLEGYIDGIHFGLYHEEMLVCVLTMERKDNDAEWNILRFTTILNTLIVDASDKLILEFSNTYIPQIINIALDIRFNKKNSFLNNEFIYSHNAEPNCFYLNENGQRSKIINNDRIWDCGKYTYIWTKSLSTNIENPIE